MNDFGPFAALLQKAPSSSRVPSERLELMGKQAAADFINNGIPLNDALIKRASPDMTSEQLRRTCEYANQATFNEMFKAASGDFRVPDFDVAEAEKVASGFSGPAPMPKLASAAYSAPPRSFIKSAGVSTMEKAASAAKPSSPALVEAFPLNRLLDARTKISAVISKLEANETRELSLARAAHASMIDKMAEAVKEGNPVEAISVVCLHVDSSEDGVKEAAEALSLAHHRLGEASPKFRSEVVSKLGHLEVKSDNPISTAFGAYRNSQIKVAEIREAKRLAKEQKAQINTFLRDHIQ